jgi:hypothetical protein
VVVVVVEEEEEKGEELVDGKVWYRRHNTA